MNPEDLDQAKLYQAIYLGVRDAMTDHLNRAQTRRATGTPTGTSVSHSADSRQTFPVKLNPCRDGPDCKFCPPADSRRVRSAPVPESSASTKQPDDYGERYRNKDAVNVPEPPGFDPESASTGREK